MRVRSVEVNCHNVYDWDSFHDEFQRLFGFPEFYGRNMGAWIACMSSLDRPEDGMTQIHCRAGEPLTLKLNAASQLKTDNPEIYHSLTECSAFVNWRLVEAGQQPVLPLAYKL